jgi:hypothetical protein
VRFSTSALQALRDLHDAMRASPARDALARLLQRPGHGKQRGG